MRTRSRNIENQLIAQPMVTDDTPDQNENLDEELLRINQLTEEADQLFIQLNDHILNANNQIIGPRITSSSSQLSAPINPSGEANTNNIIEQDPIRFENLPNEPNNSTHPLTVNHSATSSLTEIQPAVAPSETPETTAISSVISLSAVQLPSLEQAPGSSIDPPLIAAPPSVEVSDRSPYFAPNSAISEANV